MKVSFQLNDPSARNTFILCSVNYGSRRARFSTQLSIEPRLWSQKKGRIKNGAARQVPINSELDRIAVTIEGEFLRLRRESKQMPPAEFATHLKKMLWGTPDPATPQIGIDITFEQFFADRASDLTESTLKVYRTIQQRLKEYQKFTGTPLDFHSLNRHFFQKYTSYLVQTCGLSNPTIEKEVERLRAFLRYCDETLEIPLCRDYLKYTSGNLPKGERSRKVYLNQTELKALKELPLEDNRRLDRVRDLFLFLCRTGMRFGDAQSLRAEHFKDGCFELVTQKNRRAIKVPAHPDVLDVWVKYESRLPNLTNQVFNRFLKELCKVAGIDEDTVEVTYKGASRVEQVLPKYEFIGAHTAKRSFVTNNLIDKVSIETLCEVTGNNAKTIQSYIVPTGDDVRRELNGAWGMSI